MPVVLGGTVAEGKPLVWRITLSSPADETLYGDLRILPVRRGTELSTKDVAPAWLKEN
ncbi:hypothetical protein [Streptomyces caeruleatus]|uniref:hypothetical protein n=1 Tax=Streptomyces caeruleatus TaxID=661399 RepID=UPI00131E7DD6|nr:hypothetical protein [Streptomyces caeruleatus]